MRANVQSKGAEVCAYLAEPEAISIDDVISVEDSLFVQGRNTGAATHTIFTRNGHIQSTQIPALSASVTASANADNSSESLTPASREANVNQVLDGLDVRTGLELLTDATLARLAAERDAAAQYQYEPLAPQGLALDESLEDDVSGADRLPQVIPPDDGLPAEELEAEEALSSVQDAWVQRTIVKLKKEIERYKKPKLYRKGYFKIEAPIQAETSSASSSIHVDPDSLVLMDIFVWLPLHLNGKPECGFACPRCKKRALVSKGQAQLPHTFALHAYTYRCI